MIFTPPHCNRRLGGAMERGGCSSGVLSLGSQTALCPCAPPWLLDIGWADSSPLRSLEVAPGWYSSSAPDIVASCAFVDVQTSFCHILWSLN